MHVNDELVHRGQHFVALVNDEIGAFGDDIELVISDDRCNFNDDVFFGDQPRHFQIHPHKHIGDDTPSLWRSINAPILIGPFFKNGAQARIVTV